MAITGTQTGSGDATANEYNYESDHADLNFTNSYDDHFNFTGMLSGTSATFTDHIHGSMSESSSNGTVTDSYNVTRTYQNTPGFDSGMASGGHYYPFGVGYGGGRGDLAGGSQLQHAVADAGGAGVGVDPGKDPFARAGFGQRSVSTASNAEDFGDGVVAGVRAGQR